MTDADIDPAAVDIAALGRALAPRFDELFEALAPQLERVLWPEGAPAVVTWARIFEAALEAASGEEDDESEAILRDAGAQCLADEIVLGAEPRPEALPLHELFARTTEMMVTSADAIDAGVDADDVARMLIVLLRDVVIRLPSVLALCGRTAAAAQMERLVPELEAFEERLAQPARPLLPTAGSGDATAALLERLADEVRRVAPALADVVERDVFSGSPPRRVSFSAIQMAMDTAQYGDAIPDHARHAHALVAESDALLMPEGDEPVSARELLEETAISIEGAARALRRLDPDARDEMAPRVELQSRLFLLSVVHIAQLSGHQLLVAEIARAIGLDPVPFTDDLSGEGSA